MVLKSRIVSMIMLVMFVLATFVAAGNVYAKDQMLEEKIHKMSVQIDKNGNEYVRFIIKEKRELGGVTYMADTVVMAFGTAVESAKKLAEGDTLKAICSQNEYQGRKNYNIIQIL